MYCEKDQQTNANWFILKLIISFVCSIIVYIIIYLPCDCETELSLLEVPLTALDEENGNVISLLSAPLLTPYA